jgi:hypothetical protein
VENEMRSLKNVAVTVGLLTVLLAGSLWAQSRPVLKLDAEALPWKHLAYKAKKVFGTVKTEIQWQNLAAEKVKELLIPVPRGEALQSADIRVFSIEGLSVVKPLWGSVDELKTQAWYDPGNGDVLQRIRWRQGKERWQKSYRFTEKGVWRIRKKPDNPDEIDTTPDRWSDIEESFYPYTLSSAECTHALEPLVLLYLVSAIDLESREETLSLCVFNKKQLHQVQIRKAGVQRMVVDYRQKLKEGEVRREGEIEAVKYSFKTRSLASKEKKPEPFSFLGLKGDFDIYLDKTARIPVQVSGHITGFGKVNIRLHKIEIRK